MNEQCGRNGPVTRSLEQRSSNRELNKPVIVSITCLFMFLLGLPYCTNAGVYILELIDHYAAGFPYLCIAFLETIIISYTYGSWHR